MDNVEVRRRRIINIIYLAIILGLSYLFLKYCFWMFFPFIFAFFIAIIVQKPSNYITKKTKLKKSISSTILVLILIIIIGAIISLIGEQIVDGLKNFASFISDKISDLPTLIENIKNWVLSVLTHLPTSIESRVVPSITEWFDTIKEKSASEIAQLIVGKTSGGAKFSISSLSTPLSGLWSTAKQIPSLFVAIMVSILCSCFIAADYDTLVNFIKNQMPEKHKEKLSRSKRIVFKSIGKVIRSYVIIICITGIELAIGLSVLTIVGLYDSGHIIAISIVVALLDILPVIGTGTFMVPWSLYSLITGKIGLGIGLFIVYAIIYVVRQIIEPKIVGGTVGLPPFVTLIGMYIGSQLFGFIGIFVVPLLIIMIKLLNDEGVLHIWKPSTENSIANSTTDNEKKAKEKKKFSFNNLGKKNTNKK